VALLACAVLLAAAAFLWSGRWNTIAFDQAMNDQAGYVTTAMHLAADGTYESSVCYPGLLPYLKSHNVPYMPGAYYVRAAFFRALGVSLFASQLPNLLAFVATAVLAFLVGARLSGLAAGWLFALLVVTFPPMLLYAYSSMNESLVVALCLGAVLGILAAPARVRAPLVGPLLVLPILVREDALLMLPGLAVLLALEQRTGRLARVAVLCVSAVLARAAIGLLPAVADRPPILLMHVLKPSVIFYDATPPPVGSVPLTAVAARAMRNVAGNAGDFLASLREPMVPWYGLFLLGVLLLALVLAALTPLVPARRRPWHLFAVSTALAALERIGMEGVRGFAAPFWMSLDYVIRDWPVRWSFDPINEPTLALVAASMPLDLLVTTSDDILVNDPRTGMQRRELLGGALRLRGEIPFTARPRERWGQINERHRLLIYRAATPPGAATPLQ